MRLLQHPATANVFDHLRAAGDAGLPASEMIALLDRVRPLPIAIEVLREVVALDLVSATPMPVTLASTLRLTKRAAELLEAEMATGAWYVHRWRIQRRSAESLAAEAAERESAAARLREIEAAAYQRARAVVESRERYVLDADAVALLRTLFAPPCAFLRITPAGSELYLGERKSLRPTRPIAIPLGAALSGLFDRVGDVTPGGPLVLGLPAGAIASAAGGFAQHSFEAKLVWLMPRHDELRIVVRDAPARIERSFAAPVTEAGAHPYREPADWAPTVKPRDLAEPRACPHCGALASRYRDLRLWLQCLACARTFLAEEEDPSLPRCGKGLRNWL